MWIPGKYGAPHTTLPDDMREAFTRPWVSPGIAGKT